MDFVCACVTPAQANDYFDDYFTVKIFDILGITERRKSNGDKSKGGLIFFRIRGKEERERGKNRKRKNRGGIRPSSCGNPAPSPSHGNYLSLPRYASVLPPFFFPRIVEFRTILLSLFLSNPSLSLVCAKAPLPNLFSRVENLTVVEGQFVLLWEPRRDRTIKPRIRNWIVITLDGLEEEILFFFFKKSGSISRFKGRDFFSPTICLNYEKMERKYLKEI